MLRPIQCFLIDDDPEDREIFSLALDDIPKDIHCTFASDGVDALQKLQDKNFKPDYIFIDINMPRMDGRKCLMEIRKIDRLRDSHVFIYSTSSDPTLIRESRERLATDFITKPPSISVLKNILHHLFTKYQSEFSV